MLNPSTSLCDNKEKEKKFCSPHVLVFIKFNKEIDQAFGRFVFSKLLLLYGVLVNRLDSYKNKGVLYLSWSGTNIYHYVTQWSNQKLDLWMERYHAEHWKPPLGITNSLFL